MAQFRTTADIIDTALENAGEVTNGNSPYESQALKFINKVHIAMIAGGTIPLGKDETVTIDESWPWARASRPLILELQPKFDTGSVALTLGSDAGTFSSAPSVSVKGWYIRLKGKDDLLRIGKHTAGETGFELDAAFTDTSETAANFECFKLDYELVPEYLVIDSSCDKMQFQKTAGSTITATLTHGVYTPAALISHVATVMTAAAGGPAITGSYSAITRKFTLTSDLAGATSFFIVGNGSSSAQGAHRILGFDDETSSASAASHTSTYILGGIARIVEPMKIHKLSNGNIFGVDAETLQRDFPMNSVSEGYPTHFGKIGITNEGIISVRFCSYPKEKTRVEVEYVPFPRDLKDDAASIPLLPRQHVELLEDAATFFIMLLKADDRMQVFASLVQGKLKAMIAQHRGSLQKTGENFGQIIPRRDLLNRSQRRIKTEPY